MPTTASGTFANTRLDPVRNPHDARQNHVALAPSLTLAAGTILGELTATPGTFKAYASGNADGSQVPKCILVYPCTTDASGNIDMGGEYGVVWPTAPAYENGVFNTADLVGLDANALTVMGAHLTSGVIGNGVVRFP